MNGSQTPGWLAKLDRSAQRAENLLLVAILIVMLGVAMAQIILRNGFGGGFVWSDEFLRLTVLWVAMLGSIAAARDHRHLRIDILSRYLPPTITRWTTFVVDIFTALICGILTYYSYLFVAETLEYEDMAFGSKPLWWFQVILPLGFGLIAWRYLIWAVRRLKGVVPERDLM